MSAGGNTSLKVSLDALLEAAARRHRAADAADDFLPFLMHEVRERLALTSVALWRTHQQDVVSLGWLGTEKPGKAAEADIRSAIIGDVAVVSATNLTTARRLIAGAQLVGDHQLVLDATECDQAVDEDLLIQLADVFADLQRRRMLDRHLQHSDRENMLAALVAQLHDSLDPQVVANTLATDGAAVLKCRRVAVARRIGRRRWDVAATTGVSQPNQRSDAARQICEWVEEAAGRAGDSADTVASVSRIEIPLSKSKQWQDANWAAVFENEDDFTDTDLSLIERISRHAVIGFANCETLARATFTGQIRRALQAVTRSRAIVLLLLPTLIGLSLWLIPSELRIEVYGELAPVNRAFVFAPDDGTIAEIFVDDGSEVSTKTTLCILENEDLAVRREAVDGELAAAVARLAAIDAMRGDRSTGNDSLLSAEQVELKEKTESLTRQAEILKRRIEELNVVSRISGQVFGDRLKQLLFRRPVQRGQYLFEVADPESGWQLDLRIPEADARHVLNAIENTESNLQVSFSLETSPETFRRTELHSLAASTDLDPTGTLSTLAVAKVEAGNFADQRPGTGVVAYIHCGKFSTGYVWFRKVIEFVHRNTWL